jgi:hypothetical protein
MARTSMTRRRAASKGADRRIFTDRMPVGRACFEEAGARTADKLAQA